MKITRKKKDDEVEVEVDSAVDTVDESPVEEVETCESCSGTGRAPTIGALQPESCPVCLGTGKK